jgi:hypothetical protein
MLSKLKKIFFIGIFGVLYVSFLAQLVYALIVLFGGNRDTGFIILGLLSVEWLVLIGARYLSKKSAGGGREGGYHSNYRR